MMDRKGEQHAFKWDGKQVTDRPQWRAQAQECSICGDVGFSDQLRQCTVCHFRFQHTYCSTSREGLRSGTWICDWCRLVTKEKGEDDKNRQAANAAASSVSSDEGSWGLECLLKVALNEAQCPAGIQTSSGDRASLCSSSVESVKENGRSPGLIEARSCSSEDRISQSEETMSTFPSAIPGRNPCDSKKSPKSVRCRMKIARKRSQKSLLEQQCGSVQLKQLFSLKSSKAGVACDPPRSFVRRYKSLSNISF